MTQEKQKAEIIKTAIIVVDKVGQNDFGDLTFTDKEGKDYKVSVKRKQYFERVIVPDMAVQLNYAMSSFGKEYIYGAVQVKDKMPQGTPLVVPAQEAAKNNPIPTAIRGKTEERQDSIETQCAAKIIGELYAGGILDGTHSLVIKLMKWLDIKIK